MGAPRLFVGVDGCRGGWIGVSLRGSKWVSTDIFGDIESLWQAKRQASLILMDMPIGLKDGGCEERRCDVLARKLVGKARASSIFRIPCRKAIYSEDYNEALRINRKLTGRGFSIQTWNIVPRIREVDELMRSCPEAVRRLRETHPELCFQLLGGVRYPKRSPQGRSERIAILARRITNCEHLIHESVASWQGKANIDDLIDALILAVTASRGLARLTPLPLHPVKDSLGIPMQMLCPSSKAQLKKLLSLTKDNLK